MRYCAGRTLKGVVDKRTRMEEWTELLHCHCGSCSFDLQCLLSMIIVYTSRLSRMRVHRLTYICFYTAAMVRKRSKHGI